MLTKWQGKKRKKQKNMILYLKYDEINGTFPSFIDHERNSQLLFVLLGFRCLSITIAGKDEIRKGRVRGTPIDYIYAFYDVDGFYYSVCI